jgi:hypothetical protein
MDNQTAEIVSALSAKIRGSVLNQEFSPLSELYDPRREKFKLKKTALAQSPASAKPSHGSAPAKPAAAPAAPAKPDSEKQALAKVQAANAAAKAAADKAAAEKAKHPEAEKRSALSARLKAIKGALNQSLETLDIDALLEEFEQLLSTELDNLTEAEIDELVLDRKALCLQLLTDYELDEQDVTRFRGILLSEGKPSKKATSLPGGVATPLTKQGALPVAPAGKSTPIPSAPLPGKLGLSKKMTSPQIVQGAGK